MPRASKTKARKPGGQPGNKNAEKHGFYSRNFTKDETTRLESSDRYSLDDELDLLRVYVDRISKNVRLNQIGEDDLKALNTLSLMTQSISTMIRTHYLTKGKGGAIEQGILEALEEIRLEMGL
jgi:hypothetical protein